MTDDEKPPLTYEQQVELVIAEILKRGTTDRVETIMLQKTALSEDEIQQLIEHAQLRLVSSAPAEIRASLSTVISYHRWNDIYQKSSSVADRIAAQKQLDRLMGSIH